MLLLGFLFVSSVLQLAAPTQSSAPTTNNAPLDRAVKIYHWPLSKTSPSLLAQVRYSASTKQSAVEKYTPPSSKSFSPDDDVIRIGLYEPASKAWSGIVTSAASFEDGHQASITLHLDNKGEVWHVNFLPLTAKPKANGNNGERLKVELASPSPGPRPHLNVPVVLDPDGKVPDQEAEKPLWQRYWWVFLGLAFLMLSSGGGGDA